MSRIKKTDWASAGILAAVVFLLALLNFSLPHDIITGLRSAVMVVSLFLIPAGAGVLLRLFVCDKGRTALALAAGGGIVGLLLYSLCFQAGGVVFITLAGAVLWSMAVAALYYFITYCIQTTRRSRKTVVIVVTAATLVVSVALYSAVSLFFGLMNMD